MARQNRQSRLGHQPLQLQPESAQWQNGIMTPSSSPIQKPDDQAQHTNHFKDATSTHQFPEMTYTLPHGPIRPPPAQMLPPNVHPSIEKEAYASNPAAHTASSTQPAWLPAPGIKPVARLGLGATHPALYRAEPAVGHSFEPTMTQSDANNTRLRAPTSPSHEPLLGIFHPDFPRGLVDPSHNIHRDKDGPPQWKLTYLYNPRDCESRFGNVVSPTMLAGLPFGGFTEAGTKYPDGDALPEDCPREMAAECTGPF